MDIGLDHVLFEVPGPTRQVRKHCKCCYEVMSENEGTAGAAEDERRVKPVCNQFDCIASFAHPVRFIFALSASKELTQECEVKK